MIEEHGVLLLYFFCSFLFNVERRSFVIQELVGSVFGFHQEEINACEDTLHHLIVHYDKSEHRALGFGKLGEEESYVKKDGQYEHPLESRVEGPSHDLVVFVFVFEA